MQTFLKSMHNSQAMLRTSSINVHYHSDVYLTPVILVSIFLKNVSNSTSPPQGQQLCQIVLKPMHSCTSYGPDKSGRTHGCTDARTYTELKLLQLFLAYPKAGSTKIA